MTKLPGSQFEILVDGKPRSYPDPKAAAMDATEFIKSRGSNCEVAVKDLLSAENDRGALQAAMTKK